MSHERLHLCPKDGCGREVPNALLACPQHWAELPPVLRTTLTQDWRAVRRYGEQRDWDRYLATRQRALAILNG